MKLISYQLFFRDTLTIKFHRSLYIYRQKMSLSSLEILLFPQDLHKSVLKIQMSRVSLHYVWILCNNGILWVLTRLVKRLASDRRVFSDHDGTTPLSVGSIIPTVNLPFR